MGSRRTSLVSPKSLLSKQLANIADTLTKASQRRDAELQRRRPKPTTTAIQNQTSADPTDTKPVPSTQHLHDQSGELEQLKEDILAMNSNGIMSSVYATSPTTSTDQPKSSLCEARVLPDDDDSWVLLKPSHQAPSSDASVHWRDVRENLDPKKLRVQTKSASVTENTATNGENKTDDDPRRMLAELESLTASSVRLVSEYRDHCSGDSDEDEEDFTVLRCRLEKLLASSKEENQTSSGLGQTNYSQVTSLSDVETFSMKSSSTGIDPRTIPYVVAVMLEDREFQWELVNSWTTYLFSDGPEGYESQRRNEVAVSQAQSILDETIKKAINEEISCRINEERRLVVRNIAAAATEEDLQQVFSRFGVHIHNIHFTNERDLIRNTQTAHIDMVDKETANAATYIRSHIFGLILDIKIATAKIY